jgi:hypothetical protein
LFEASINRKTEKLSRTRIVSSGKRLTISTRK